MPGQLRIRHCDDGEKLVFGALYNGPVKDNGGKFKLDSELAVSYSRIRERRRVDLPCE